MLENFKTQKMNKKNIILFFEAFLISALFTLGINLFYSQLTNFLLATINFQVVEIGNFGVLKKPQPQINAKSAISLQIYSNGQTRVIFSKNEKEILPIASLTKLMSALVVLAENYKLDEKIQISKKAAAQPNVPVFGNLKEGEEKTVRDLLKLMLIYSSNDAALALAEKIGVENFVQKMNKMAETIGLKNTKFQNPTGLDPENLFFISENKDYFNTSNAEDLAKLAQYILVHYPLIFEITREEPIYKTEDGIFNLSFQQFTLIGGKTGFTRESGGCLLLVLRNTKGEYFINVILGAKDQKGRVEEMQKLINWLSS
jgi:D-alanyl-D-alanine carboxypeptidase (penicillin-binding protein 5/6)